MSRILHVATERDWERAQRAGIYAPESLAREGFIHCSTDAQLERTLALHFAGRTDLMLLVLSTEHLGESLRWDEPAPSRAGEGAFPHVYGPIPIEAIEEVRPLHE